MDTVPAQRYYKRGEKYICENCPYAEERVCARCVFAKWNVEGLLAGLSPDQAYRQTHRSDLTASPLILDLKVKLPRLAVPSHNRLAELMRQLER